jgi:hypothetical protein
VTHDRALNRGVEIFRGLATRPAQYPNAARADTQSQAAAPHHERRSGRYGALSIDSGRLAYGSGGSSDPVVAGRQAPLISSAASQSGESASSHGAVIAVPFGPLLVRSAVYHAASRERQWSAVGVDPSHFSRACLRRNRQAT